MFTSANANALAGGILIGLAAVLLLALHGRIFGVSGVLYASLQPEEGGRSWRLSLLAGLLLGAFTLSRLSSGSPLTRPPPAPAGALLLAGVLVGFGALLGSGCTSGHGVCGLGRLSPRSFIATLTFLAAGMITATCLGHTGLFR